MNNVNKSFEIQIMGTGFFPFVRYFPDHESCRQFCKKAAESYRKKVRYSLLGSDSYSYVEPPDDLIPFPPVDERVDSFLKTNKNGKKYI